MDIQTKKQSLIQVLRENDLLDSFSINEKEDGTVLFQTQQNIKSGRCVISIVLRENNLTPVYFFLGTLDNPAKEEQMLGLLNQFNIQHLLLKFTLEEKDIIGSYTYASPENAFDALDLLRSTFSAFGAIDEYFYSKLMKLIWA